MTVAEKTFDIYTLGPKGTNCEAAAHFWLKRQGRTGKVFLFPTLEQTAEEMPMREGVALLGCVVYPKLHHLVFRNLGRLALVDCFIMKTLNMVLASRAPGKPRTIATHPAPESLIPYADAEIRHSNSNAQAALDCANGLTEGCITTLSCAKEAGLPILRDFGQIEMGFTIHAPVISA